MEVNGTLAANNLTLAGSTLAHTRATATTINRLNVNVNGTLTVDATSAIDVSTRGLTGSANGTAYTYDRATDLPTLTNGATNNTGGSHGGQGGPWTGNVAPAYGSPFDPNTPGGAGASGAGVTCSPCRSGGGVARIRAATVQLDGKILANGEASNAAGAGGSIRIDAGSITGAGEIHADGGTNTGSASGGGGRIALYYQSLTIPATKITAAALQANSTAATGEPGTIYLRQVDGTGAKYVGRHRRQRHSHRRQWQRHHPLRRRSVRRRGNLDRVPRCQRQRHLLVPDHGTHRHDGHRHSRQR